MTSAGPCLQLGINPSTNPAHLCSPPPPCSEFEVDFVTLSYCRGAEDVLEAREFLAAIGAEHTKVPLRGGC